MDEHGISPGDQEAAAFESPSFPAAETVETGERPLSEGIELDPRFGEVREELVSAWEKEHGDKYEKGSNFFRDDFLDFYHGAGASPGIDAHTREAFVAKFPEDAKAYEVKELTRIYPTLEDDPAYRSTHQRIIAATNAHMQEVTAGLQGEEQRSEANRHYWDVWNRYESSESMHQMIDFVRKYPEKSEAYSQSSDFMKWAIGVERGVTEYQSKAA